MISSFNLSKLHALLKDFYTLTKIRITVFDETFRELIAYPEEISLFCQTVRADPEAYEKCRQCDQEACRKASYRHSPYTYRCHAGLTESITPLYMGNIIIGYLLFGHVFSYGSYEEGWKNIMEACGSYKIDFQSLRKHCRELPLIQENYISSASHIMQAVASYLCLDRMATLKHEELPVRIDDYITKHFTENIDAGSICAQFKIGKTFLYEISKQSYGVGIAEHIRNLRIAKAQKLLRENSDMNISQIASECGFNDYNYFITVFRRIVGVPPKQYRQSARNNFLPQ